jgi:hypothetical protein
MQRESKTSWRTWRPRFTVAGLLWLTLVVAVTVTAYRYGLEAGRKDAWRQRAWLGRTYTKVYYVPDLVTTPSATGTAVADFRSLIEDLETEVFPNTWNTAGGTASAAGFPTNLSLVVSHDQAGHEEVANFLQRQRNLRSSAAGTMAARDAK